VGLEVDFGRTREQGKKGLLKGDDFPNNRKSVEKPTESRDEIFAGPEWPISGVETNGGDEGAASFNSGCSEETVVRVGGKWSLAQARVEKRAFGFKKNILQKGQLSDRDTQGKKHRKDKASWGRKRHQWWERKLWHVAKEKPKHSKNHRGT